MDNQISKFDIALKPFNRKDLYIFDVLMTTSSEDLTENDIQISSSHPIKWVDLISTSKIIVDVAKEIVSFGSITISYGR